jgi:hypothetical protein
MLAGVLLITGNNRRWVFASRTAESTLALVRRPPCPMPVVLVNAPDEWEGAYIFRNSFNQGLVVNGIDTSQVVVTHFLTRLEYLKVNGKIEPVFQDHSFFIYPSTRIVTMRETERTYYWDKYEWKKLISF